MKILLINDYGVPMAGAELLTFTLRDGLRKRGHDARLFSSTATPFPGGNRADYTCFGTAFRFQTILQVANLSAFRNLRRVLRDFRPDVVQIHMFLNQLSPLILLLLRNVPTIYFVLTYKCVCPLGTKFLPDRTICNTPPGTVCYRVGCLPSWSWIFQILQHWLWKRWRGVFSRIVANSQAMRHRLANEGIDPDDVVLGGVPPCPPRPALAPPPTVAFVARLVPGKGGEVLIRAFSKVVDEIPDARLLIVGDGSEKPRLKNLVDDLRLTARVSMTGYLERGEMEQLFFPAWVQVVPSLWEEPFGLAALDAMMRGTAVVASSVGGLPEIVDDNQTGILVPPGDPISLAEALKKLLLNPEFTERMGETGRKKAVEKFHEDRFVDAFLGMYQELCRERKARK